MTETPKSQRDYAPLEAMIVGDEIVIRLPIDSIPMALKIAIDMGTVSDDVELTDATTFAKFIVDELNAEDEEGTTELMAVFDEAMERAINNGADGVDVDE